MKIEKWIKVIFMSLFFGGGSIGWIFMANDFSNSLLVKIFCFVAAIFIMLYGLRRVVKLTTK